MHRQFFTIILLVVFMFSMGAIAGNYQLERAQKVTSDDDARFMERLNNITYHTPAQRQNRDAIELGRTWYDYATNNVMGRMIAHALTTTDGQDGIHCVFMKILPQNAERYVTYDYYDLNLGLFFGNVSVTEDRRTGWGRVINGKNDEAIISLHSDPSQLWFDAGEAGFTFTNPALEISPLGVFEGFGVHGDSIVFLSQLTNTAGQAWWVSNSVFKYSEDYGQSWSDGTVPALPAGAVEYSEAERWPQFNPTNPGEIGFASAISEDATASAGGWLTFATTTDWGATWNANDFWWDDLSVTSSPFGNNTQYVIENFTQMNSMYTSDGNFHIVYGAVQGVRDSLTSTAIDYWPILHWDSNSQTFSEVTTLEFSAPDDPLVMASMADNRPGNGLGNAYPHIAEDTDGGVLVCIWQQWEKAPIGGGMVLINATTGGGTGTFPIFATDIWAAISYDGGATWQDQQYIAGTPNESDVYPNITRDVIREGDSLYLDILYMDDTNPNVSLSNFTNFTDPSECIWNYERVAIYAPVVGVEDGISNAVDGFSLSQNYPNPFNPTTKISFNLQKRTNVTLDVFNTLGQKVATLLDGAVNPGAHDIEFDGKDLTSGIYFYQLTADNFKQTKKMVLMK